MVSVNDFACVRATVILNVIGIGSGHHSVPCVNAIKELLVSLLLLQVLLFWLMLLMSQVSKLYKASSHGTS